MTAAVADPTRQRHGPAGTMTATKPTDGGERETPNAAETHQRAGSATAAPPRAGTPARAATGPAGANEGPLLRHHHTTGRAGTAEQRPHPGPAHPPPAPTTPPPRGGYPHPVHARTPPRIAPAVPRHLKRFLGRNPIMTAQRPPAGLKSAGRRLWSATLGDYDLEVHELLLLREACRTADRLDRLEVEAGQGPVTVTNHRGDEVAHPAMVEARQQSIVLARLLAALRMPAGDEADLTRPQRRGGARGAYGVRGVVAQPVRRSS